MNLLLIEDDAELIRQLSSELERSGDEVTVESNGRSGLEAALRGGWDIIILDVSLPEMSGFDIILELRAATIDVPVLFLSAKGDVNDRVRGLSLGGDDYLTKPYAIDELRARLGALGRRRGNPVSASGAVPDGWVLDSLKREVTVFGQVVALQPREWSLLELFLEHDGEVLTNSFLLERVWGICFDPGTNVVNTTISRLRRKLDAPGRPTHFETMRGRGHAFKSHV
jgi:two-component system, OmpR family, response regulator